MKRPLTSVASGLSASLVQRLSGGASRLAALLLPQILPVSSVVAPCHPGAALRNPLHNRRGQTTRQTESPGSAPPRSWQRLAREYPDVVAAYDTLSEECRQAGPLDESTVALVKLAVSVGCGAERTVHAHAKKALRAGVDPEALRQIALVALPTVGLPAALDALRWVDESIGEEKTRDV